MRTRILHDRGGLVEEPSRAPANHRRTSGNEVPARTRRTPRPRKRPCAPRRLRGGPAAHAAYGAKAAKFHATFGAERTVSWSIPR